MNMVNREAAMKPADRVPSSRARLAPMFFWQSPLHGDKRIHERQANGRYQGPDEPILAHADNRSCLHTPETLPVVRKIVPELMTVLNHCIK